MNRHVKWLKEIEFGASNIYRTASALLAGDPDFSRFLEHMAGEEEEHGRFLERAENVSFPQPEEMERLFTSTVKENINSILKAAQSRIEEHHLTNQAMIDILVYIETVMKGRRVFLDYRENPAGFALRGLSEEALAYLTKSNALQETPLARLRAMNPAAIDLYRKHGINLARRPLEIAVCAQHNNGGLAANHWWESANLRHLFPVGEVNGSHGIYRPGGSALNSGQVGGFRAAEFIARRYGDRTLDRRRFAQAAKAAARDAVGWNGKCRAGRSWREEREELQARMTRAGAHIRSPRELDGAVAEARAQWQRLESQGCLAAGPDLREAWNSRQLCFAHLVYLEAVRFAVKSGAGSRGSSMVLDPGGTRAHDRLDPEWSFAPPNPDFREKVLETAAAPDGTVSSAWVPRRPLPKTDTWFETAWAAYRDGEIYR